MYSNRRQAPLVQSPSSLLDYSEKIITVVEMIHFEGHHRPQLSYVSENWDLPTVDPDQYSEQDIVVTLVTSRSCFNLHNALLQSSCGAKQL